MFQHFSIFNMIPFRFHSEVCTDCDFLLKKLMKLNETHLNSGNFLKLSLEMPEKRVFSCFRELNCISLEIIQYHLTFKLNLVFKTSKK